MGETFPMKATDSALISKAREPGRCRACGFPREELTDADLAWLALGREGRWGVRWRMVRIMALHLGLGVLLGVGMVAQFAR